LRRLASGFLDRNVHEHECTLSRWARQCAGAPVQRTVAREPVERAPAPVPVRLGARLAERRAYASRVPSKTKAYAARESNPRLDDGNVLGYHYPSGVTRHCDDLKIMHPKLDIKAYDAIGLHGVDGRDAAHLRARCKRVPFHSILPKRVRRRRLLMVACFANEAFPGIRRLGH
jgi:hypothetical protein